MKSHYTKELLSQFFYHSYSSPITKRVQKWIVENNWTIEKDDTLHDLWEKLETKPDKSLFIALEKVKTKIGIPRPSLIRRHLPRVAAVFIPLFLVIGEYLYFHQDTSLVKVITSNNEQKTHTLPDGSEVWLNAGSTIIYSPNPNDPVRLVTLQGEAYFSVHPDKTRPFIVQTNEFSVKALGTKFNVYAYPSDSRTIATLTSGKIQIDLSPKGEQHPNQTYILLPQQQFIYHKQNHSISLDSLSDGITGWKEGALVFQDATLQDILNTLQRHYGIAFRYDPQSFPQDTYSVKFIHRENINQVLEILQDITGKFNYEKEKNNIITITINKQHE